MNKELLINEAVLKMEAMYPMGKFNVGLSPEDFGNIDKTKVLPDVSFYKSIYIREGDFYINHYEPQKPQKKKESFLNKIIKKLFS